MSRVGGAVAVAFLATLGTITLASVGTADTVPAEFGSAYCDFKCSNCEGGKHTDKDENVQSKRVGSWVS